MELVCADAFLRPDRSLTIYFMNTEYYLNVETLDLVDFFPFFPKIKDFFRELIIFYLANIIKDLSEQS